MQVISEITLLKEQILQWRNEGQRVAFIPTMGYIHDGHLALIRKARKNADIVVVSISTNPLYFEAHNNPNLSPSLDEDINTLNAEGVDLLFTPSHDDLTENETEEQAFIEVPALFHILEGSSRPQYFRNTTTELNKLFNIVQPDMAFFSEKDYQKLAIIKKMVNALHMPIEIISIPTVREIDGLAVSKFNAQLTVDERQRAPVLGKTLRWINSQMRGGRNDYSELVLDGKDQLRAAGLEPEDIYIRDAKTLHPISENTNKVVIIASVLLGQVRLIDNLTVHLSNQSPDTPKE